MKETPWKIKMVEETEIVEGSEGRSTICTLFGSYSEDRRKQPHAIKGYDYLITDYTNYKVKHEINPNYLIFDLHARGARRATTLEDPIFFMVYKYDMYFSS